MTLPLVAYFFSLMSAFSNFFGGMPAVAGPALGEGNKISTHTYTVNL